MRRLARHPELSRESVVLGDHPGDECVALAVEARAGCVNQGRQPRESFVPQSHERPPPDVLEIEPVEAA
jgi:hypothetical protein